MPSNDRREPEPSREAKEVYTRWIEYLDNEFTRHKKPSLRAELVRDNLHQLLLGQPHGGKLNFTLSSELPFNVLQLSLDPTNVTLEAGYDGDVDVERYASAKPLIWFWHMYDHSPVALNQWLGFRFRAMLGKHLFKKIGENIKIFHGVEFTFGYNLTVEDDCVIRSYAVLDDREDLVIGKGTTVANYEVVSSQKQDQAQGAPPVNRNN